VADDNDSVLPTSSAWNESFYFHLRKLQRHPKYLATKRSLRTARTALPTAWRRATQGSRQLPGAIIVGAAKAGTTQLFAYMLRHPRCFGPAQKEIHYFSYWHDRGLPWYRAQFPWRQRVERVRGICLEASPSYLPRPEALSRMRELLPNAAIIAILRDPVARAFSHYQHERTRRREARTFAEVVAATVRGPLAEGPESAMEIKYVADGYYAQHLEALLQVYPREQVLILDSDDLFDDTNGVCQQVFAFLGLESCDVQPDKIYNRGFYRETVDEATRELLREHYRPFDERLVQLTGRRFRWMDAESGRTAEAA
jgi:hypothetical protein